MVAVPWDWSWPVSLLGEVNRRQGRRAGFLRPTGCRAPVFTQVQGAPPRGA